MSGQKRLPNETDAEYLVRLQGIKSKVVKTAYNVQRNLATGAPVEHLLYPNRAKPVDPVKANINKTKKEIQMAKGILTDARKLLRSKVTSPAVQPQPQP